MPQSSWVYGAEGEEGLISRRSTNCLFGAVRTSVEVGSEASSGGCEMDNTENVNVSLVPPFKEVRLGTTAH